MSTILLNVINMSISASYMIIAIIILRCVFKKVPKFIFYILWGLVAIRLICPFSFETNFSLAPSGNDTAQFIINTLSLNKLSDTENLNKNINEENLNNKNINFNNTNTNTYSANNAYNTNIIEDNSSNNINYSNASLNDTEKMRDNNELIISNNIINIIWITGIIAILTIGIFNYLQLKKQISASILIKNNIYVCDNIKTPFVLGMFKPKIYLPSNINKNEQNYILLHERTHLKHLDNFWKPIAYIILSIYWFNPLIWLAYILFCKDIEFSADEDVIKNLNNASKKEYAEILLSFSIGKQNIIAYPVAFGEISVKERIKNISNYKNAKTFMIIFSMILGILICLIFFTNAKATNLYKQIRVTENYDYILKGKNCTYLFVDSISIKDYEDMMKVLYPSGIVDEQGQEIGGVKNLEEVRDEFIRSHENAYAVINGKTVKIDLEPFFINIESYSDGNTSYLYYRAKVNKDIFVFPSEWNNSGGSFLYNSEKNLYFTITDTGIYKIDTEKLVANKISSDEYKGKSIDELRNDIRNKYPIWHNLTWIDNPFLSPNGDYILYNTNRTLENPNYQSVFKLDLKTGIEEEIVVGEYRIYGFISDDIIITSGSTNNYNLVNINTKEIISLQNSNLEYLNFAIIGNSKMIFHNYNEEAENGEDLILFDVNLENGTMTKVLGLEGIFRADANNISPDRSMAIYRVSDDPNVLSNKILIIDMANSSYKYIDLSTNSEDTLLNEYITYDNLLNVKFENDESVRTILYDINNDTIINEVINTK